MNYFVFRYVRRPAGGGRPYYCYERTCGTERAARERVDELGPGAVYLVDHLVKGFFY